MNLEQAIKKIDKFLEQAIKKIDKIKVAKEINKINKISFMIEREGAKREVSGIQLYDKLVQGWKIKSYKIK